MPSAFYPAVSSQFQIGTRRGILNGEKRSTQLLSRGARASNSHEGERRKSGAHASSPSAAVAPTATPDARHPDRSSNRRPVQLELTITPPHASCSDYATHPGGAWNRRFSPLANHNDRPFLFANSVLRFALNCADWPIFAFNLRTDRWRPR